MEPLVSYISLTGFKLIIYGSIAGLGLTACFLVGMLVKEIITKKVW